MATTKEEQLKAALVAIDKAYEPVVDRIEKAFEAAGVVTDHSISDWALMSIAVSMRRIADRLDANSSELFNAPAFRTSAP